MLNLKTEKTSEEAFYKALLAAETEWKDFKIEEYSATESVNVESLEGTLMLLNNLYRLMFLEEIVKDSARQIVKNSLIEEKMYLATPLLCETE